MPRQRHYYEPLIQQQEAADLGEVQLAGFDDKGVTYVRLPDVIRAIELYADTVQMPERGVVLDLARWLGSSDTSQVAEDPGVPVRVEVFPDAEGKWHARSIGEGGHVLKVTNGSFDEHWVIKDVGERWPGLPVYRLQDEQQDSLWQEAGRFGPSPRLWHGTRS